MQKVYISLFIVLLFSCCTSLDSKDAELEYPIEINNKDLVEAIIEYQNFLYKDRKADIERGDSVYVGVWSRDVNDSIYRYYLAPVRGMLVLPIVAPFDLCRVNGHHVIFSHAILSMKVRLENRFSILSDMAYVKYSKILFPKEYEENNKGKWLDLDEPDNIYLTFLGDSLIDKTIKRGMPREKIPVKLNGEEVYL